MSDSQTTQPPPDAAAPPPVIPGAAPNVEPPPMPGEPPPAFSDIPAPPIRPAGGPPVIPWQMRGKDLGRGRAYWRTVWLVIGRNGRLDDYLDGPVDYKDAQRFRWRTIAFALLLPTALFCLFCLLALGATIFIGDGPNAEEVLSATLGFLGVLVVGLVALAGATGVVSWFFCPRHYDTARQNRAIALSYYTCAPLAFWPVAELVIALTAGVIGGMAESPVAIAGIAIAGNAALVIWWYQLILRAVHYIADRPGEQVVLVAILLPAAWALVELVMLIVPAGIVLLAIMYLSVT